ncbi:MAG: SHOCT domain-containing protein [Lachnospiraceae bacterium]|nr:SHOCT domain-containing protein [Lachnospiraceae bacterium]
MMRSARIIRVCSIVVMIVIIILSVVGGIIIVQSKEWTGLLIPVIWAAGVIAAVMLNAFFQGFADLIDNTYACACALKGEDEGEGSEETGDEEITGSNLAEIKAGGTQEQTADTEKPEKYSYAKELLDKGLIDQEEYEEMLKKESNGI